MKGCAWRGERNSSVKPMVRHRDLMVALGGMDSDLLVNEVMIRFCAAFLDQGIAHRTLPDRDCGLLPRVLCNSIGREAEWQPGG